MVGFYSQGAEEGWTILLCSSWHCRLCEGSLGASARKPFFLSDLPTILGYTDRSISLPGSLFSAPFVRGELVT